MTTKNNAFILDFELLKEHNLTLEEFLTLIRINEPDILISGEIIVSLQTKQFLKKIDDTIVIREKGKMFLELISIDRICSTTKRVVKKSSRLINTELNGFIEKYRELWRGKKAGSMGAPSSCRTKLERWMEENPTYSTDDIMKAAKLYLDTLDNMYYLQRADYFIYKVENGVESSRLSSFIDEIGDKPVTDWTTTLS